MWWERTFIILSIEFEDDAWLVFVLFSNQTKTFN
jgi:hypothetical protein